MSAENFGKQLRDFSQHILSCSQHAASVPKDVTELQCSLKQLSLYVEKYGQIRDNIRAETAAATEEDAEPSSVVVAHSEVEGEKEASAMGIIEEPPPEPVTVITDAEDAEFQEAETGSEPKSPEPEEAEPEEAEPVEAEELDEMEPEEAVPDEELEDMEPEEAMVPEEAEEDMEDAQDMVDHEATPESQFGAEEEGESLDGSMFDAEPLSEERKPEEVRVEEEQEDVKSFVEPAMQKPAAAAAAEIDEDGESDASEIGVYFIDEVEPVRLVRIIKRELCKLSKLFPCAASIIQEISHEFSHFKVCCSCLNKVTPILPDILKEIQELIKFIKKKRNERYVWPDDSDYLRKRCQGSGRPFTKSDIDRKVRNETVGYVTVHTKAPGFLKEVEERAREGRVANEEANGSPPPERVNRELQVPSQVNCDAGTETNDETLQIWAPSEFSSSQAVRVLQPALTSALQERLHDTLRFIEFTRKKGDSHSRLAKNRFVLLKDISESEPSLDDVSTGTRGRDPLAVQAREFLMTAKYALSEACVELEMDAEKRGRALYDRELKSEVKDLRGLMLEVHRNQIELSRVLLEKGVFAPAIIHLTDPQILNEEREGVQKARSTLSKAGQTLDDPKLEELQHMVDELKCKCKMKNRMIMALLKGLHSNAPKQHWEELMNILLQESDSLQDVPEKFTELLRKDTFWKTSDAPKISPEWAPAIRKEHNLEEAVSERHFRHMNCSHERRLSSSSSTTDRISFSDIISRHKRSSSASENGYAIPGVSIPAATTAFDFHDAKEYNMKTEKLLKRLESEVNVLTSEKNKLMGELLELKGRTTSKEPQSTSDLVDQSFHTQKETQPEPTEFAATTINVTIKIAEPIPKVQYRSASSIGFWSAEEGEKSLSERNIGYQTPTNDFPAMSMIEDIPEVPNESIELSGNATSPGTSSGYVGYYTPPIAFSSASMDISNSENSERQIEVPKKVIPATAVRDERNPGYHTPPTDLSPARTVKGKKNAGYHTPPDSGSGVNSRSEGPKRKDAHGYHGYYTPRTDFSPASTVKGLSADSKQKIEATKYEVASVARVKDDRNSGGSHGYYTPPADYSPASTITGTSRDSEQTIDVPKYDVASVTCVKRKKNSCYYTASIVTSGVKGGPQVLKQKIGVAVAANVKDGRNYGYHTPPIDFSPARMIKNTPRDTKQKIEAPKCEVDSVACMKSKKNHGYHTPPIRSSGHKNKTGDAIHHIQQSESVVDPSESFVKDKRNAGYSTPPLEFSAAGRGRSKTEGSHQHKEGGKTSAVKEEGHLCYCTAPVAGNIDRSKPEHRKEHSEARKNGISSRTVKDKKKFDEYTPSNASSTSSASVGRCKPEDWKQQIEGPKARVEKGKKSPDYCSPSVASSSASMVRSKLEDWKQQSEGQKGRAEKGKKSPDYCSPSVASSSASMGRCKPEDWKQQSEGQKGRAEKGKKSPDYGSPSVASSSASMVRGKAEDWKQQSEGSKARVEKSMKSPDYGSPSVASSSASVVKGKSKDSNQQFEEMKNVVTPAGSFADKKNCEYCIPPVTSSTANMFKGKAEDTGKYDEGPTCSTVKDTNCGHYTPPVTSSATNMLRGKAEDPDKYVEGPICSAVKDRKNCDYCVPPVTSSTNSMFKGKAEEPDKYVEGPICSAVKDRKNCGYCTPPIPSSATNVFKGRAEEPSKYVEGPVYSGVKGKKNFGYSSPPFVPSGANILKDIPEDPYYYDEGPMSTNVKGKSSGYGSPPLLSNSNIFKDQPEYPNKYVEGPVKGRRNFGYHTPLIEVSGTSIVEDKLEEVNQQVQEPRTGAEADYKNRGSYNYHIPPNTFSVGSVVNDQKEELRESPKTSDVPSTSAEEVNVEPPKPRESTFRQTASFSGTNRMKTMRTPIGEDLRSDSLQSTRNYGLCVKKSQSVTDVSIRFRKPRPFDDESLYSEKDEGYFGGDSEGYESGRMPQFMNKCSSYDRRSMASREGVPAADRIFSFDSFGPRKPSPINKCPNQLDSDTAVALYPELNIHYEQNEAMRKLRSRMDYLDRDVKGLRLTIDRMAILTEKLVDDAYESLDNFEEVTNRLMKSFEH